MKSRKKIIKLVLVHQGFTLIELLVSVSIIGVLMMIAIPNLNSYLVESRVDNEISELHRLILTARNTAINSGKNVTLCPLSTSNVCGTDWKKELTVFNNTADNTKFDSTNEQVIKVKAAIKTNDSLTLNQTSLVYSPTGRLISGNNSVFIYCPKDYPELARGINISLSGRVYASQDTDNDDKDEDRSGNELTCS
ncbi:GspH/FimT family pseudopilin [Thalassotalea castellviae]|uniref:Type II secretion system protein H n=1 Tax=Thalassotalea castellviae TaxID=3075612 RepID=A0ABU3A3C9_9GAMM|nr:GspH/FimT family pseudopilin [Thalassotalea sp. W431]MDT0604454.1 GspH/FimT family pseudopilin [Thalassotalea sp. W431]